MEDLRFTTNPVETQRIEAESDQEPRVPTKADRGEGRPVYSVSSLYEDRNAYAAVYDPVRS